MTSGLPPSRLMEQKNSLDLFKRNLQDEFANLGSTDLTSPAVVSAPVLPAVPAVPLPVAPVQAQAAPTSALSAGPQSNGSYSSFHTSPM